jgi:hypothetical protein
MTVKLETLLQRNKINLKSFIAKNKITSYEDIIIFCEKRNYLPCTLDEYNLASPKEEKVENVKKKKKPASRRSNSTQAKKQSRNTNKKVKSPQKLPDSDV